MKPTNIQKKLQQRIEDYEAMVRRLPIDKQKAYKKPGSQSGRK